MKKLQSCLPTPFEGHLNRSIKDCILDEGWSFTEKYLINKTARSRWRSPDCTKKYTLPGAVIYAVSKLLGGEDISKSHVIRFANAPNAHLPFIKYNNFSSLMFLSGQFTFNSNQPFEESRVDEALVEVDLGFKTMTASYASENEFLWCRAEICILEAELHISSPDTQILAKHDIFSDSYELLENEQVQRNFFVHFWEKDEKSWQIVPALPAEGLKGKFQKTLCMLGGRFHIGDRASLMFRPLSIHASVYDVSSPVLSASLANASAEKRAVINLLIEEEIIDTMSLVDGCGFELEVPHET